MSTRTPLKVMPSMLLRWPAVLEVDFGGMAGEAETSQQLSVIFFLLCGRWQQWGKMVSDVEVRMSQRCVADFLPVENVALVDTCGCLLKIDGDQTVDVNAVKAELLGQCFLSSDAIIIAVKHWLTSAGAEC